MTTKKWETKWESTRLARLDKADDEDEDGSPNSGISIASAELVAQQAKSLNKLIKSKRAFRAEFGPLITVEGLTGFGRAAFSKKKQKKVLKN
jgi:hypothetical protein